MGALFERPDAFSYYRAGQPTMRHLDWTVRVDFDRKVLFCVATIEFTGSGEVTLDTRDLKIDEITDQHGNVIKFEIGVSDKLLGAPLTLTIPEGTTKIMVVYQTSPNAQ